MGLRNPHLLALALLAAGCSLEQPGTGADDSASATSGGALDSEAVAPGDSGAVADGAGSPPARVLMISVDTLRRDRVGRYSGLDTSPTLDALLADGLTLEDHRSCSNWTYSSVTCIYTGRYELDLGWFANGSPQAVPEPLPSDTPTLAQWLKQAGYATALVSANAFISPNYNMTGGFDEVVSEHDLSAAQVVDGAIEILDGALGPALAAEQPVFLHAHFLDPHLPYNPPEAYQDGIEVPGLPLDMRTIEGVTELAGLAPMMPEHELAQYLEWIDALYQAEIRAMDDEISRLLAAVDERGDLAEWAVVFWSDHGEQFYEHGGLTHHVSLYGEETRGVVSFSGPGVPDAVIDAPTTHADLAPTLLDLLGLPVPEGVTGLPAQQVSADRPRFGMFVEERLSQQAVDYQGARLLYRWNGDLEYYRLDEDPGEQRDLYQPGDPEVQALWALLEPRVQALDELYGASTPRAPEL